MRSGLELLGQANVTGPGWTDELARLFDPRVEGPRAQ